MKIELKIFCPIYISPSESLIKASKYLFNRLIHEIDAKVSSVRIVDTRFLEIEVEGNEAEVASNYLKRIFGVPLERENLQINSDYPGRIIEIGDDALYVDIGLRTGEKIKILKHVFVMQMLNIRRYRGDITTVLKYMGIGPYFPLVITIKKIGDEIFGLPARKSKIIFRRWMDQRVDRIYVWGFLRSHLDKVLRGSKEYKNIIRVDRLGLLEHHIVCKFGIFGDELADRLSRYGIKNSTVLMPRKLRKLVRTFGA